MKKKILALLMVTTLALSMTACGGESTATKKDDKEVTVEKETQSNKEVEEVTDKGSKEDVTTETGVQETILETGMEITDKDKVVEDTSNPEESSRGDGTTTTVVVDGEEITLENVDPVELNVTGLTSVEFDNVTYTLGVSTLKEFLTNTGFIVNDVVLGDISNGYTVEPFATVSADVDLSVDDLNTTTYVFVYNDSEAAIDILDCKLVGIVNDNTLYQEDGLEGFSMSSAGFKIGDSIDSFKAVFGEPQESATNSYFLSYLWDIITPDGKFWVTVHTDDAGNITTYGVELR